MIIIFIFSYLLLAIISSILNFGIERGDTYMKFNILYEEDYREDLGRSILMGVFFPIISTIVIYLMTGFAEGGFRLR